MTREVFTRSFLDWTWGRDESFIRGLGDRSMLMMMDDPALVGHDWDQDWSDEPFVDFRISYCCLHDM